MREIHMLQKQHSEITVTWHSYQPDGTVITGPTMDHIHICENLDEEVAQAERYLNLEMDSPS